MERRVAIVPARAGSKRILGKNTRPFLGVPVFLRVLRILDASELFDDIIVSTENESIARLATAEGYSAPFVRPDDLADDFASTADVVRHAINWLLDAGVSDNAEFLVAYPTAVFMTIHHLRESLELLKCEEVDHVFAGCRFPSEVQRAWWKEPDNSVKPLFDSHQDSRSQDLRPAFYDAGQFYWSTSNGWSRPVLETGQRRRIYEIDPLEAVDINTEEDWARAEAIFQVLRCG